MLKHSLRDIIAVAHTVLAGMARAHAIAHIVMKQSCEGKCRARRVGFAIDRSGGQAALNSLEQFAINERLMLPDVGCAPPDDLAEIEAVLQEMGESSDPEPISLPGPDPVAIERFSDRADGAGLVRPGP